MANYRKVARRAARAHGLDPNVFERQIGAESGFNPHALSPKGARGIAQIMPKTAAGWHVNPDDPRAALNVAAAHMAADARKYGSVENALRAYNAGPGAIQKSHGYAETNAYVRKILGGSHPKVAGRGGGGGVGGSTTTTRTTTTTPGVDNSKARAALVQSFLSDKHADVLDFAIQARGLRDVAPTSKTSTARSSSGGGASDDQVPGVGGGATADPSGKRVANWIEPALAYARAHGWKGTVTSGFRSRAEQQAIWNSGVRPAARPGTSNHEATVYPRGAVDVSQAQQLAQILRGTKYGRKLKYAGAKDPVHFSHPHGGSY